MPRLRAWFDRFKDAQKKRSLRKKRGINHTIAKVAMRSGETLYYLGKMHNVKALTKSARVKNLKVMR
jgi:hypothetical protein